MALYLFAIVLLMLMTRKIAFCNYLTIDLSKVQVDFSIPHSVVAISDLAVASSDNSSKHSYIASFIICSLSKGKHKGSGDLTEERARLTKAQADKIELELQEIEGEGLMEKCENYNHESIPKDVLVLSAGIDTQNDRVEITVIGYGENMEAWVVEHRIIWGNPATKEIWMELDEYLKLFVATSVLVILYIQGKVLQKLFYLILQMPFLFGTILLLLVSMS